MYNLPGCTTAAPPLHESTQLAKIRPNLFERHCGRKPLRKLFSARLSSPCCDSKQGVQWIQGMGSPTWMLVVFILHSHLNSCMPKNAMSKQFVFWSCHENNCHVSLSALSWPAPGATGVTGHNMGAELIKPYTADSQVQLLGIQRFQRLMKGYCNSWMSCNLQNLTKQVCGENLWECGWKFAETWQARADWRFAVYWTPDKHLLDQAVFLKPNPLQKPEKVLSQWIWRHPIITFM